MGTPGSGKTIFARRLENEYNMVRYSQDEHGGKLNKSSIKKQMTDILNENKSIIIDATNSSSKNRQIWIDFANELNKSYIIVWFVRDGRPFNELRILNKVPPVAYGVYTKYFTRPLIEDNYIIMS